MSHHVVNIVNVHYKRLRDMMQGPMPYCGLALNSYKNR